MQLVLLASAAICALIALWEAISCHGGLLRVPWWHFLRKPTLVGGHVAILANLLWILVWTAFILLGSAGFVVLAWKMKPVLALAARSLHMELDNNPELSLGMAGVFGACYLTFGTRHTCRRLRDEPPTDFFRANQKMTPKLVLQYLYANGYRLLFTLFLTALLVPLYKYFLDRRGIIEEGSALLLEHEFDTNGLLGYYDQAQRREISNPEIQGLTREVKQWTVPADIVHSISTFLIRRHGYGGARDRVLVYTKARPVRKVGRCVVAKRAEFSLLGAPLHPCNIQNVAEDGSGLGIVIAGDGLNWGVAPAQRGIKGAIRIDGSHFDVTLARFVADRDHVLYGVTTSGGPESRSLLLAKLGVRRGLRRLFGARP
jgi:hypothetical protein